MGVVGRSWQITKLSFGVIGKDKEMLLFPVLASLFSIAYMVAMLVPSGILELLSSDADVAVMGVAEGAILFTVYLGLAFISTFFNVCVVYTTKTRFEGGDATFGESLRFALSRIGLIFQWSLLSATVGLILAFIDRLARRSRGAGGLILGIIRRLLGMAWSIVSLFVIPVMVYEGLGPRRALGRSVEVIKKTWGESLVRYYGLGVIQFFTICGVILLTIIAAMLAGNETVISIIIMGGLVATVVIVLIFNVANTVFNTALYAYATSGEQPDDFDDEALLQGAFRRGE